MLLLVLALPFAAAACELPPDPAAPSKRYRVSGLTGVERAQIVTLHNRCRSAVRPGATPALPPLVWSDEAAAVAQGWARECRFAHNARRGRYGENIAYHTRGSVDLLVRLWLDEARDYAYATDRCRGEACGHYTQVVWRATRSVGCGAQMCPFGRYLVCNYSPPGNRVGQRPY